MADEKHCHHLFHRHKGGDEEPGTGELDYEKKEKHYKHLEQLGGLGVIAAGAYAIVLFRGNIGYVSGQSCSGVKILRIN